MCGLCKGHMTVYTPDGDERFCPVCDGTGKPHGRLCLMLAGGQRVEIAADDPAVIPALDAGAKVKRING